MSTTTRSKRAPPPSPTVNTSGGSSAEHRPSLEIDAHIHTPKRRKTEGSSTAGTSTSVNGVVDVDEYAMDVDDHDDPLPSPPPSKGKKIPQLDGAHLIAQPKLEPVPTHSYNPDKNAHLKGRKRFNADLKDLVEETECTTKGGIGIEVGGLRVKNVRAGDDEGSFEVSIEDPSTSKRVLSVNLLISDTSEYPHTHSCFGYSPDPDISSRLNQVVEDLVTMPPRSLRATVEGIVEAVKGAVEVAKKKVAVYHSEEEEEEEAVDEDGEEEEDYGYDAFDEFDSGNVDGEPNSIFYKLQANFLETLTHTYKPSLIPLSPSSFVISLSLPLIHLATSNTIPPRALMAWDRRLLSRAHHLALLITGFHGARCYPPVGPDGAYTHEARRMGVRLGFKVGLVRGGYRPDRECVREVARRSALVGGAGEDASGEREKKGATGDDNDGDGDADDVDIDMEEPQDEETTPSPASSSSSANDKGRFESFSLSSSLENLMDQAFLKLVQLRKKFGLGWAGAEVLHAEVERVQKSPEDVFGAMWMKIIEADRAEVELSKTTKLPDDPLRGQGMNEDVNLPLTAFCYLIRRLSLCTRYCLVCHNKLNIDFEALKPYVCDSKLCAYQYYSLNRGPSLEYEIIHNPETVDLLVSLAYSAAAEGAMDDPLPVGMGLRVPHPGTVVERSVDSYGFARRLPTAIGPPAPPPAPKPPAVVGIDGMVDFDDLELPQMRAAISNLIESLPSIQEMKKHLERKVDAGKSKPKLKDLAPSVLPAAWSILRWCVASCTAHLEEITSGEELIKPLDTSMRQFKLTVGAPDAEAKFKEATRQAQKKDKNARQFPVLYAFHGSALKNWHSIIRHGLWFKTVVNGRAFGDGVYLAKDGITSMGHYAQSARFTWSKSKIGPTSCTALVEAVNLPKEFVSNEPHYVVQQTHWLMCRYLLVKCAILNSVEPESRQSLTAPPNIPLVKLDPKNRTLMSSKPLEIPDPSYRIEALLKARMQDYVDEPFDEEDMKVFNAKPDQQSQSHPQSTKSEIIDIDDSDDYNVPAKPAAKKGKGKAAPRPKDDWKHDPEWVRKAIENLMPAPQESSPSATMAVNRELKAMLREQETAKSLKELGWYMPPDEIGDNLFQWIVEMHSFDPDIPIAKDLKAKGINSVIFEIRFPPSFPIAPPYFRILTPRFLQFIHGGGGHITAGGSICMDLLTSDGWLPSYSVSAILLQIKLAISNLDPSLQDLRRTGSGHMEWANL